MTDKLIPYLIGWVVAWLKVILYPTTSLDTFVEGGKLLLTQYLNAGGVIVPTVQVDEDVSVVGGRPRELGAVQ